MMFCSTLNLRRELDACDTNVEYVAPICDPVGPRKNAGILAGRIQ